METTTNQTKTTSSRSQRRIHTSVSFNMWFLVILVSFIPGINFLFLIFWAFIQKRSHSLRNFSRAALLWIALLLVGIGFVYVYIAPDTTSMINCIKSSSTKDIAPEQLFFPEEIIENIEQLPDTL